MKNAHFGRQPPRQPIMPPRQPIMPPRQPSMGVSILYARPSFVKGKKVFRRFWFFYVGYGLRDLSRTTRNKKLPLKK